MEIPIERLIDSVGVTTFVKSLLHATCVNQYVNQANQNKLDLACKNL